MNLFDVEAQLIIEHMVRQPNIEKNMAVFLPNSDLVIQDIHRSNKDCHRIPPNIIWSCVYDENRPRRSMCQSRRAGRYHEPRRRHRTSTGNLINIRLCQIAAGVGTPKILFPSS
jgi:hypothetical protein